MLNVVVFFRNSEGKLARMEEYKAVQSIDIKDGCYQIVNKGGTRIRIPLTSIDNIIENEEGED